MGAKLAAENPVQALLDGVAAYLPQLKQPVLGICLGMQLLFLKSEEGPAQCLGVLPQTVRKLEPKQGRPVPHMGWNRLHVVREDPLLDGVAQGEHLYFVHSYAAPVSQTTLATCDYGGEVTAAVERGALWGTQFHPESESASALDVRIFEEFLVGITGETMILPMAA